MFLTPLWCSWTVPLWLALTLCPRPISSAPGAWIDVMQRDKSADHTTMSLADGNVTALNLSSYNYLGFAECDLEMRDEVVDCMRK